VAEYQKTLILSVTSYFISGNVRNHNWTLVSVFEVQVEVEVEVEVEEMRVK
jgi:hypothetical protein